MAATPLRNYRSSDEEHERAQRAAELRGEDLSTVIRRELARYSARVERESARAEAGA